MSVLTLTSGSIFANRYRITRRIAQGGMGAVYEATHLETERPCAVKVMLPDMVQSDEMRGRFRQEARVTATIRSEFIVDVLDAGIDEETKMPFLVMELLHGEELKKRLQRGGKLAPDETITYLYQAALALDKTHRASIVHRDLKPENLFLTERDDGSPRVKILDFGIAKLIADGTTNAGATSVLGTPLYMAPEQFQMGEKISPATDIYALGMMAFTMLVGTSYWADEVKGGGNIYAFIALAVNGPQEPATARAGRRGVTLPAAFDGWFGRATALAPKSRFAAATEAILALAEALGVSPPAQRSATLAPKEALSAAAQTLSAEAPVSGSTPPHAASDPALLTLTSAATTVMKPKKERPSRKRAAILALSASVAAAAAVLGVALFFPRGGAEPASGAAATATTSPERAGPAPAAQAPEPTVLPANIEQHQAAPPSAEASAAPGEGALDGTSPAAVAATSSAAAAPRTDPARRAPSAPSAPSAATAPKQPVSAAKKPATSASASAKSKAAAALPTPTYSRE
jgi:serine/threonine protein kinase